MDTKYKVLYTHQKLKKKKTWQDGYLKVSFINKKAILMNDNLQIMDSLFIRNHELCDDTELESDKYLITIECKDSKVEDEKNESDANKENVKTKKSKHNQGIPDKVNKPFFPVFSAFAKKSFNTQTGNQSAGNNDNTSQQPLNNNLSIGDSVVDSVLLNHIDTNPTEANDDVNPLFSSYSLQRPKMSNNIYVRQRKSFQLGHPGTILPTTTRTRSTNEILKLLSDDVTNDVEKVSCSSKFQKPGISFSRISQTANVTPYLEDSPDDDGFDDPMDIGNSCVSSWKLENSNGCVVPVGNSKRLRLAGQNRNETYQTDDDSYKQLRQTLTKVSAEEGPQHKSNNYTSFVSPRRSTEETTSVAVSCKPTLRRNSSSFTTPAFCMTDYNFPSREESTKTAIPRRVIKIPFTFTSAFHYKQTLKSVLKEHLNIVLFDVASKYFSAMSSVDLSSLESGCHVTSDFPQRNSACKHGPAKMKVVRKEGKNNGRIFYSCPSVGTDKCNYFQWADEQTKTSLQITGKGGHCNGKVILNDYQCVTTYLNSRGIQLYCGARISRKVPFFKSQRCKNKGKVTMSACHVKKLLFLVLPYKKASSYYAKGDIWIISKNLEFDSRETFIARSMFYGPNSSAELEILPLAGYSMSNWQNNEMCVCIQACNASSELTCIDNLNDFVNPLDLPVLTSLLSYPVASCSGHRNIYNRFNLSCMSRDDLEGLVENTIETFSLNEDQKVALRKIADMFVKENENFITLIHGVFGAGKSYLLATVVLFLVQLFDVIEDRYKLTEKIKLLISSTTNVAVDRVLQTLLELGYQDFVRVGSIKKIAKPILPYSVHASDQEDQEMKELNELAKNDLTDEEKGYVRKAIEQHKLGINRKRLNDVSVVGVTCAACVFPYLQNLTFQVQLLDECSQMTEPTSLLPIARFKCERLVLVGDPKQLSPTISGSEASHDASLEMTMFERLQHMGQNPIILRTQYRCHPSISQLCNEMFYDGVLINGVSDCQRMPLLDWLPTVGFCDVSMGQEQCQSDGSFLNEKEAELVVKVLVYVIHGGIEPNQVGVITQYKSQVWKITSMLHESNMANADVKAIQISTVDAFQGAEKEIILLSCVRTRSVGFIDCPRRTNVALSRAKRHLLVVGNKKLLSPNLCWGGVLDICKKQKTSVIESAEYFLQEAKMQENEY